MTAVESGQPAIDLDGRTFRGVQNSATGEVSADTVFHYHQDGDVVWAEYSGGTILRGHLVGLVKDDGRIELRYHHANRDGALMTGECVTTPEVLADGRLRLHERWQWTSGDRSAGESVVEEIGAPHQGEAAMEFDLAAGTAVLERTPATLRALLSGLPPAWTDANEGPDTWSPYVVVGHLIHGEKTDWIPRARIILAQGEDRRFEPYDRFAQFRESEGKTLAELLDEFASLRAANIETLRGWNLGEAQLALEGGHPALGRVTLRQLLATWVAHDLGHLVQVSRVMARQYRDAVGPWRAYLSVLNGA